jgi:Right handed beta helix region
MAFETPLVMRHSRPRAPVASYPNSGNTGLIAPLTTVVHDPSTNGTGWRWQYYDASQQAGYIEVFQNNVTLPNLDIRGGVFVLQGRTGFTMSNCRLDYAKIWEGATQINSGCVISDCLIVGPGGAAAGQAGNDQGIGLTSVWFDGSNASQILRCNISGSENGVVLGANNCIIRDNYINDMIRPPYNSPTADPHTDGIQIFRGQTGTLIEHNFITMPPVGATSAIISGDAPGTIIRNNRLRGGTYVVYFDQSSLSSITNNRMALDGALGYMTPNNINDPPGNPTISGNVNDDTGLPITP